RPGDAHDLPGGRAAVRGDRRRRAREAPHHPGGSCGCVCARSGTIGAAVGYRAEGSRNRPLELESPLMEWENPDFVEIKMDAEVTSYQDDLAGDAAPPAAE